MLQVILLGGLLLAMVLNHLATPLRSRYVLEESASALQLRSEHASLRLDALMLAACSAALLAALLLRTSLGIGVTGGAALVALALLVAGQRFPPVTLDRTTNQVRRGARLVCPLDAVSGAEITPGMRGATLELRYRGNHGAARQVRLLAAPHPRASALADAINAFLGQRP